MTQQEQGGEDPAKGAAEEQAGPEPTADAEAKGEAAVEGKAEAKAPDAKKPEAEEDTSGRTPPPPGGIADLISQALPDLQIEAYMSFTDVTVEIGRDDLPSAMPVLKEDPRLDLKLLRDVFGVDHQEDGFDVIYQLMSLTKGHEVVIKTRLPRDDPKVASVTPVWNAANWHERETRDMFGIEFEGHPHLIPLLLPEDMTDHFPLRKDNPLAQIEEWQADNLETNGNGDAG